jgi:EAL domain-containing protein (putative c-di-GMP-specific phosphodiesterase class I)
VNILKIDRSFTRDIPTDIQATTLTLSIIAMAHALNMQVVAEGVETKAQLQLLQAHDCDFIQGHYFSEPLQAEEFVTFMMQHNLKTASAK